MCDLEPFSEIQSRCMMTHLQHYLFIALTLACLPCNRDLVQDMCNRRHNKQDLHLPYIIYCMYICMYICAHMRRACAGRTLNNEKVIEGVAKELDTRVTLSKIRHI